MFKLKTKMFSSQKIKESPIEFKMTKFLVSLVLIILSCSALGLMGLYFSAGTYKLNLFSFYLKQPKLIALNILPYIIIGFLMWFISNRVWFGFLFSSIVCLAYSFTNYWKLVSRDDPFFAEDISLVKEAMQMSDGYVKFTWQMYLAVFLVIIGTVVLAFLIKDKLLHFSLRIVLPLIVMLVCVPLYTNIYSFSDVYNSFTVWNYINPWFENSQYISRGGIYPFIYSIQKAIPNTPEGYTIDGAKQLLGAYDEDIIPEDKQVNIMFVMYEAFSDLSQYTDAITSSDPYEYFHLLQDESYTGNLVTNIFAGGTINTERSVLTGFSALSSFQKPSWRYARYFEDMGYYVEGSHAGYKAFYNRYNVNSNLGIDDYKFIENYFNSLTDGIPMDDIFLSEIGNVFYEEIESGKKVFSFNVTYQNHGPYATTIGSNEKEYVPLDGLSEEDYAIINNYLRGIEDTSQQMYELVNQFRNLEEPVILVFFGDHKPWLGEYSSTYAALGIDIFEETEESFYNHYNTEYMIWANDSAKKILDNEFVGQGPDISPCFLMNVLFEQCGWAGPSFMKLSDSVMEAMPVVTTLGRYLQNGELVTSTDLLEENKELLCDLQNVQFYLSNDFYKDLR